MRPVFTPVLLAALTFASACTTSPRVDDAYVVYLSEDERSDLDDLRVECARLRDELAAVERSIDVEQERREVAERELALAEDEVDLVEARAEAAVEDPQGKGESHDEDLADARAHVAWARGQVDYHEALVAQARAEREVAARRVDVAEANLELRKARAVSELEDDRVPDVPIGRYEDSMAKAERRLALAEVDADAARERAQVFHDRMDEVEGGVPEARRASWRRAE